jgi:hypothetical protein
LDRRDRSKRQFIYHHHHHACRRHDRYRQFRTADLYLNRGEQDWKWRLYRLGAGTFLLKTQRAAGQLSPAAPSQTILIAPANARPGQQDKLTPLKFQDLL